MSETLPPTSGPRRAGGDHPASLHRARRLHVRHRAALCGVQAVRAEEIREETVVGPVVETSHRSLTNEEYDAVAAAVERICPRDEEPGAIDLGVPEYIDRALSTPTLSPRPRRVRARHRGADAPGADAGTTEAVRRAGPRRAGRAAHRVQGLAPGQRRAALLDRAHRADDGGAVRRSGARREPRRARLGADRLRPGPARLRRSRPATTTTAARPGRASRRWPSPRWTRWWSAAVRAARPWRSSSRAPGYKVVLLEKGPRYGRGRLHARRDLHQPAELLHAPALGRAAPLAGGADREVLADQPRLDRQLRGRRHGAHERVLLPAEAGGLPDEVDARRAGRARRWWTGPSATRICSPTTSRWRRRSASRAW